MANVAGKRGNFYTTAPGECQRTVITVYVEKTSYHSGQFFTTAAPAE
jgi:hypothetical protein